MRRLGKTWWQWGRGQQRDIWRDDSHLKAGSGSWEDQALPALSRSQSLVVLCSPRVTESGPVSREVQYWLDNAGQGISGASAESRLFLVRLAGDEFKYVNDQRCFSSTSAVPLALRIPDALEQPQTHADLREIPVRGNDARVRQESAKILGALLPGVDPADLMREDASARRKLNVILGVLAVLIVAAAVVAIFFAIQSNQNASEAQAQTQIAEDNAEVASANAAEAMRQEGVALTRAEEATSQRLSAQALALPPAENDLALLLAVAGNDLRPGPQSRAALLGTLLKAPQISGYRSLGKAFPAPPTSISADGTRVATPTGSGVVQITDFDTGDVVAERDFAQPISGLSYAPDELKLAVATDSSVHIWYPQNNLVESLPFESEFQVHIAWNQSSDSLAVSSRPNIERSWAIFARSDQWQEVARYSSEELGGAPGPPVLLDSSPDTLAVPIERSPASPRSSSPLRGSFAQQVSKVSTGSTPPPHHSP